MLFLEMQKPIVSLFARWFYKGQGTRTILGEL